MTGQLDSLVVELAGYTGWAEADILDLTLVKMLNYLTAGRRLRAARGINV